MKCIRGGSYDTTKGKFALMITELIMRLECNHEKEKETMIKLIDEDVLSSRWDLHTGRMY